MTNEAIDNFKNDHVIAMQVLNEIDVYDVLKQIFPPKNDFFKTDYIEELNELLHFGIDTKVKLIDLLAKHQVTVIEIDEEELDEAHINFYKQDYGEEYVNERVKNRFWFSLSGLLRIAMELEFGDSYREFSKKRDGV
jgi:hypothetical protein